MLKMFQIWIFCVIFITTITIVFGQTSEFVQINVEHMKKIGSLSFKSTHRIANGNRAKIGDFPWHASLIIGYRNAIGGIKANSTFCSGAILTDRWILTTADCIFGSTEIRVDVGSVDINNPLLSVYPDSYVVHPKYDKNKFQNNIALVRLSGRNMLNYTNDEFKYKFQPIRLPKKRQIDETFVGFESYFSGFGSQSLVNNNVSENLLFAEQSIIPNEACLGYYQMDSELISDMVICSLSLNMRQGACINDAGGPLVINEYGTYTLVGLLSFIHNTGNCGQQPVPAAFIRISKYYEWISNITGYQFRI